MSSVVALQFRECSVIADGAIGTELQEATGATGPTDALSLTHPDAVGDLHRASIAAGAEMLTTNTFRAAALPVELIAPAVSAAVRVARDAADGAAVGGSVGPCDDLPAGRLRRHAEAIAGEGVDALLLETITGRAAAQAAMDAARVARRQREDLPVVATIAVGADGCALDGGDLVDLVRGLFDQGAAAAGVACALPAMLDRPLARLRDALPDAALVAMPSACAPGARGLSPNDFGAAAAHIAIAHRVSLVGGCCGASPAHVAALSAALAKAAC